MTTTTTIMMRQPKAGSVQRAAAYWARVETQRTPEGLPPWTFDFVSVHTRVILTHYGAPMQGEHVQYTLGAPLKACLDGGHRPGWEDVVFDRKADAVAEARAIGRTGGWHVVDCTERGWA
jgi:hypothetical protein